jgi:hypothetical protein
MPEPTRVPPGGHDYTPEMLALAVVEAEIRGFTSKHDNQPDRTAMIDAAMAVDPRRVIETLANLYAVELLDVYGTHALGTTDAIRWAILNDGAANG